MDQVTVCWDLETMRFRPGRMAPPIVCLQWALTGHAPKLAHVSEAKKYIESWLKSPSVTSCGHNIAYDMACVCAEWPDLIPAVFQAYDENRVTDTMIREKLINISKGTYKYERDARGNWRKQGYKLSDLYKKYRHIVLDKGQQQKAYGSLRDTIFPWQQSAVEYALKDAEATYAVRMAQPAKVTDEFHQARGSFWLQLSSAWGVRTDPVEVEKLAIDTQRRYLELFKEVVQYGLIKPSGVKHTKRIAARIVAICTAKGLPIRLTEKEQVAIDEEACEATEDPQLLAYAEYSVLGNVLAKDIPMLRRGSYMPIHTSWDLAETGRTRSRNPNIQNLRRLPGIRECFRPREGAVFLQADFGMLELCTLAQFCLTKFGFSRLAEALNKGLDPHLMVAADILGLTYEEAKKHKKRADVQNARQVGKVLNFGCPGGLGAVSLVSFAKAGYGVTLTEERARELKDKWLKTWPEMRVFFEYIGGLGSPATVVLPFSNRARGGCSFTAGCNTCFQGPGSDAAKQAGWEITKAAYTDPQSPLFGARIVAFIHDEFILEFKGTHRQRHEAAWELARLMELGARKYLPDVTPKAPPVIMDYWSKEATELVQRDGTMRSWSPTSAWQARSSAWFQKRLN